MIKNKYFILIFLITLLSCGSNEQEIVTDNNNTVVITVSTSDFTTSIDEELPNGTQIGTVRGETNQGNITFSIVSQSPNNSFLINSSTGVLSIRNSNNFDYETNPQITGIVKVSNGDVSKNSNITINLNDIVEEKIFTGNVVLNTQEQVNNFGAESYTQVTGYIDINGQTNQGSLINSLSPLSTLNKVGSLYIRSHNDLTSLNGLHNITEVENDLTLVFCYQITNIDELSNITSVNGDLRVYGNHELLSIQGLSGITSVGERCRISNNSKLPTLEGLNSLQNIGGNLELQNNYLLNDISALSNLTTIGGDLKLYGRSLLTDLGGLNNLNTIGASVEIRETTLTSLNGLGNLNIIGGPTIRVNENDSLTTLDGLSSNLTLGSDIPEGLISIYLRHNNELTEIDALQNVSYYLKPVIHISHNNSLLNIDGLNSINTSFGVEIKSNPLLTNLNGLSNINTIDGNGDLEIIDNNILRNLCGVTNLIQNNGLSGDYTVSGNLFNPTQQNIINGNCQN